MLVFLFTKNSSIFSSFFIDKVCYLLYNIVIKVKEKRKEDIYMYLGHLLAYPIFAYLILGVLKAMMYHVCLAIKAKRKVTA